jgi:hypothetical protein
VTEEIPAAQDLDDARLLDLVRAGDVGAYEVLRQRHEQAARRLARELLVSPVEIDEVVAETFARVLDVLGRGGGPTGAFRAYVLSATRRVCDDRLDSQRRAADSAAARGLAMIGLAASGPAMSDPSIGHAAGGLAGSTGTSDMSGQLAASRARRTSAAMRWIAAGAAVVLAVFAIAFAVTLTGNYGPAPRHPRTAQALSPGVVATSIAPSPAAKTTQASVPSATPAESASAAASVPPPEPIVAGPADGPSPTSARLAVTVDVVGGFGNFGQVFFQVTDTGSGPTGQLTVAITLPSGASMVGGGDQNFFGGAFGWSCQPASTGAICQHARVSAGAQTEGAIFMTISGSAACGQPVQLTATSGAVAASAQSPNSISCQSTAP